MARRTRRSWQPWMLLACQMLLAARCSASSHAAAHTPGGQQQQAALTFIFNPNKLPRATKVKLRPMPDKDPAVVRSYSLPGAASGSSSSTTGVVVPTPTPAAPPAPAPAPPPPPQQQQPVVVPSPPAGSPAPAEPAVTPASPAPEPSGGQPSLQPAFAVDPAAPPPASAPSSGGSGQPALLPAFAVNPAPPAPPGAEEDYDEEAETQQEAAVGSAVPPPFEFSQPGANASLRLGCVLPFSGDQRVVGRAVHAALLMAVRERAPPSTNVTLLCEDGRCTDVPTYNAFTALAAANVSGVIGELCSGASSAAAGLAASRKLPTISPSASSTTLSRDDFFFRTVPSDRYQGLAAANLMYDAGVRALAVLHDEGSYGYNLAFSTISALDKLPNASVPLVLQIGGPGAASPAEAASTLANASRAGKVDALFLSTSNLTFVAGLLKDAAAAKLALPLYGGDGVADTGLLQAVAGSPSAIANLTATGFSPGTPAFKAAFAAANGNGTAYHAAAATGYDAMVALLRAYEAAAPPKAGPELAAQLHDTKFDGVTGSVVFDQVGDRVPSDDTYVATRFNVSSGELAFGPPIQLHLKQTGQQQKAP